MQVDSLCEMQCDLSSEIIRLLSHEITEARFLGHARFWPCENPHTLPVSACSIHFLDCWATTTTTWCGIAIKTTRHSTLWHAAATCSLVDFHHNWINDTFKFLLLRLKFILLSKLVLVQPIQSLLHCLLDLFLIVTLKFLLQLLFLQGVAHCEAIVLQAILGLDFGPILLILGTVLLRLLHHAVNLGL